MIETQTAPGHRLDVARDCRRVFEVLMAGGIAICPNTVGYGIWASAPAALQRVFETKQRGGHKRHAMIGDAVAQREIQVLDPVRQDMVECLTLDYDLPVGVIAPYRPDHPLIRAIEPGLLKAGTANGTIGMLMNGGRMHSEIGRMSREAVRPVFGSSANLSGTGTKFRVEDIQPELRAIADVIIDQGLRRYHSYQRSSTIIDFATLKVVRIGSCYELIADVLRRHFAVDLPVDPGRAALPSGHLQEFALAE